MIRKMQAVQAQIATMTQGADSSRGKEVQELTQRLSRLGSWVGTLRRIGSIILVIALGLMMVGSNIWGLAWGGRVSFESGRHVHLKRRLSYRDARA